MYKREGRAKGLCPLEPHLGTSWKKFPRPSRTFIGRKLRLRQEKALLRKLVDNFSTDLKRMWKSFLKTLW
jgi:hypothetical protein